MGDKVLSDEKYEKELNRLQAELCLLQRYVRTQGLRIVVVFEGRDAAGKGGVIKRITERVSPRVFRVVALPAPNEREKTQLYLQRYITHMPAAGEVILFDRSWYNRAGVEKVMGFCTQEQYENFLINTPGLLLCVATQSNSREALSKAIFLATSGGSWASQFLSKAIIFS